MSKVIIVGGHGNVQEFHNNLPHNQIWFVFFFFFFFFFYFFFFIPFQDIKDIPATPLLLSLEDASIADFSKAFKGHDVVYFSAGAGGKGAEERTKKVDYEGALKIFDAIEGVEGPVKPRLILLSALDVRDPEKIPAHYVSIHLRHLTGSSLVQRCLIFYFIFILFLNPRTRTISRILTDCEKSSLLTCIGSMRQIRILRNVQHSSGLSYVLEGWQIILVRGRQPSVEHIWAQWFRWGRRILLLMIHANGR